MTTVDLIRGLRPGEQVTVTIRATVTEDPNRRHCLPVAFRQPEHLHASDYKLVLPLSSPDLTVERVAPAEWPPRRGDVWRDGDGGLWFGVDLAGTVTLRGDGGSSQPVSGALRDGPWVLQFRRHAVSTADLVGDDGTQTAGDVS
jgi:hypothetical protein